MVASGEAGGLEIPKGVGCCREPPRPPDCQEERKMSESEFGKGLVICLVKFAEHFERLHTELETYKKLAEQNPANAELFTESHAVKMWANAATDHLYEIEVPKSWEKTEVGKAIMELSLVMENFNFIQLAQAGLMR